MISSQCRVADHTHTLIPLIFRTPCFELEEDQSLIRGWRHAPSQHELILHVVLLLQVLLVAVSAVEELATERAGQVEVALALLPVTAQVVLVQERRTALPAGVLPATEFINHI